MIPQENLRHVSEITEIKQDDGISIQTQYVPVYII